MVNIQRYCEAQVDLQQQYLLFVHACRRSAYKLNYIGRIPYGQRKNTLQSSVLFGAIVLRFPAGLSSVST